MHSFFLRFDIQKIYNDNSRKSAKFINCGFSKDSGRSRLQINELSARENKCLHCGVFKTRTQKKTSRLCVIFSSLILHFYNKYFSQKYSSWKQSIEEAISHRLI